MCEELCPVGINTANLALNERKANASDFSKKTAELAKENFSLALNGAKFALSAANILNSNSVRKLSFRANLAIKTPVLREYLPKRNSYKLCDKNYGFNESVVYFSSCLNRAFAPNKNLNDKRPIQEVFESLCKKAKINVIYPEQIDDICCGKIFTNYSDTKELNRAKNIDILREATKDGKYPVIIDHGACSYELIKSLKDRFEIYDLSEYLFKFISPRLSIVPINDAIGLYTMCASKKLGLEDTMMSLAKLCTKGQILVDSKTACCGFAGYKGFFTPQLNIHATTKFKRFYKNSAINIGFSNSSTCEIGLSEASGFSWQHIAYLLDRASVAKE
jgi:D-lactate dehydrogenase